MSRIESAHRGNGQHSAIVPDAAWATWLRRRVQRRQLLRAGGTAALGLAALQLAGCAGPAPSPALAPRVRLSQRGDAGAADAAGKYKKGMSEWSRHARLANASFGEDPDREELEAIVQNLADAKVSVVEADSLLSDWLTDDEFENAMLVATEFNRLVHGAGMKVVWYYPSLEVISPGGERGPSFYKSNPDWAQISLWGEPNVFYGGGVVFWVDPGAESVWLSPNGPWRSYYLNRVKRLAQTGADGIWPDVPLYPTFVVDWCDHSVHAQEAFKADTGYALPTDDDWNDPIWRRWVEWRHRNLNQYLLDIAAAGRAVNPDFEVFVETVTCDYLDATSIGLDGGYLRLAEGITQVWEVDAVSDSDAMRPATENEWLCMISMYKYGRAASGTKPAWAFDYGLQEDDAALVMAEALISGCNPYEVKIPEKTAGVSHAMRKRMYSFVEANTRQIFDARSLADVALYHSSASRDYVAPSKGSGKYGSTKKPEGIKEWWSVAERDSVYEKEWLGEYRGLLKVLIHAHIPFDVLTSPTLRAEDLDGYKLLLLPDVQAMSDQEAAIIREFVRAGGAVLATGPSPSGRNEYGDARPDLALADVLGFSNGQRVPRRHQNQVGDGAAFYCVDLLGKDYLEDGTRASFEELVGTIEQVARPAAVVDGDRRIHTEARELDGDTILQFTNFIGVDGTFQRVPTTVAIRMAVPAGKQPRAVEISSPDNPTPDREPMPFAVEDGELRFTIPLEQYALVVVSWE
jgi:hypothetical protein